MSNHEQFQPYIDGAKPLLGEEIDRKVAQTSVVYYGEMPDGLETIARENHPAIEVEDTSGNSKYSVLISGDLASAKTVLVKAMAWSDHPGRGFEALREALIADDNSRLAVIGVSFPGTFLTSHAMTDKQRESLNNQDFSLIAGQQWQAIDKAMRTELLSQVKNTEKVDELIRGYDFVLSGNSQGSVNAVGLLASAPPGIRVSALGLAQEVGLEAQGWFTFRKNFMLHGSDHFKQYTAENPYNQYPNLGPDFGPLTLPTRVATRFSTHLGATVHGMRRGGDVQRILDTVREREIQDLAVTLATGDRDGVASAEWTKLAGKVLNASRLVVAKTVIWPGHYHPAMENLANAQTAFRSFAQ